MRFDVSLVVMLMLAIGIVAGCGIAEAYVGPGPGITMLGALWAVIAAVALAVVGLLIWPLRALFRRLKHRNETSGGNSQ
ncbi:MAG: hypothetical protein P8182_11830 [Deltaproteobacteria bacterium]